MLKLNYLVILVALLPLLVPGLPCKDVTTSDQTIGDFRLQSAQFSSYVDILVETDFLFGFGGSIITDRFILVAAHFHFILEIYPEPEHFLIKANKDTYNMEQWIIHEHFFVNTTDDMIMRNDISLIKTVETIKFNELVAPIALHSAFIEGDSKAIAPGWDNTSVSTWTEKKILTDY